MVSSVDTTRLWSMQTAIRIFKENDTSNDSNQNSSAKTLLGKYGIDTSSGSGSGGATSLADYFNSESDNTDDYSLPASLTQATSQAEAATPVSSDVSSDSFMKGLRAKLDELAGNAGTQDQADAMLAALSAGTLTVTDAESGKEIKAWDTDSKTATATKAQSTDATDWSSFLRDKLSRHNGGIYSRNGDGSYIEKGTGNSAYFGTIGESYYYLSWPSSAASTSVPRS